MMQEQQRINLEVNKRQGKEIGETLKEQRKMMIQIGKNRKKWEEERKNGELMLTFKHNNDYGELFSINIIDVALEKPRKNGDLALAFNF